MSLAEGLHFERRLFHSTFALVRQRGGDAPAPPLPAWAAHCERASPYVAWFASAQNDQKEGMAAFAEKRPAKFTDN